MTRARPLAAFHRFILPLSVGVVAVCVFLATVPLRGGQNPSPPSNGEALLPSPAVTNQAALVSSKQQGQPKKSKLEKTKTDAAKLSALADQLRDELKKMNANVLSLDVIQKTEEVEKLAKKIRGEANED